ncbi:MAG: ABC transporter ATP-binding protein [Desulfobacteraceae bacterium]|nr:ABC transporter ATP-binding protein [Desulfobacteraceae bacterium]
MRPQINSENKFLLNVKNLMTYFFIPEGTVKAVDDVSFHVKEAEIVGLVGESGCGKSVTALSILGLIPWPPGRIVDGQIIFQGEDLRKIRPQQLREIRGNKISMIFQEPMTSLNPVYTLGRQIAEVYIEHQASPKKEAFERAKDMLDKLGIPSPSKRVYEYPHNLSGGMRQRVMIAMAISCQPKLIIADEPTTALDVTIQKQILDLMKEIQKKTGTSFILITHDWDVISEIATKVAVMYAGRIIEYFTAKDLYSNPMHPYARALVQSIPRKRNKKNSTKRLKAIAGNVPDLADLPVGCKFSPRCPDVFEQCVEVEPTLKEIAPDHLVRCWKYMN